MSLISSGYFYKVPTVGAVRDLIEVTEENVMIFKHFTVYLHLMWYSIVFV